jgi:ATP-dependent DNA helicase UvrD/PcrA
MLLQELNEEQQEAVMKTDGPLLVLAGAGSGKTRVVTYRIAHLIEQGIPPSKILGLTFTNKAAREMKERVMSLTRNHVLISTFHSLGARILRESVDKLGYPVNFTIYDDQDTDKLIKNCLLELYPEDKKLEAKTYKGMISKAKNALLMPDEVDTSELRSRQESYFPRIYEVYQEKLLAYGALDFDDLLFLTVRLLREHPQVLQMYQSRWSHLLVDEYQDTNAAQYTMISFLAGKSRNLCVVGDPDQSIYSWRGANIHNILHFERDYPGTQVIRLERNYRSRQNILEAANSLILNNDQRFEKRLWSELGPGEKIKCHTAYTEREEAQYIAEQIRYHCDYQGIPLSEMVIFYRTNAQSRAFEDELPYQKIPYVIVGGISFYQRREIKDILAYLRMVQSDADFISFARSINLPKRGVGAASIEKLRQRAEAEGVPIFTYCQNPAIQLPQRQQKGLQGYVDLILDLRRNKLEIGKLVQKTIESSQYLLALNEEPESYDERKENLDALIAKAMEWEASTEEPTLDAFLEELALKSGADEIKEGDDRVNLMTLHNGKGLEFTIAFLAGMEEDLLPHVNSRGSQEGLEEERRLCYVGMTRAKEVLYLINCDQRFIWGMQRTQRPSRFLKEVPYKLKEIVY